MTPNDTSLAGSDASLTQSPRPGASAIDADPRRQHATWEFLRERRAELLDGLAALADRWRDVDARHELELAVFLVTLMRELDTLLGEHACRVWYALLELADATPAWRAPGLERALSTAADPHIAAALGALRSGEGGGDAWGGSPEVRARLAEIGAALRALALGQRVPDLLLTRQADPVGETGGVLGLGGPHRDLLP